MEDSSKVNHLHEKLKQDTGISLMPLKHWWAGDGSMPSRNICENGLSRIIDGILTNDESILSSIDIWLMQDAFCATDIAPEDIDIEKVLEWLRFESIKRNMAPTNNPIFHFYNSFIHLFFIRTTTHTANHTHNMCPRDTKHCYNRWVVPPPEQHTQTCRHLNVVLTLGTGKCAVNGGCCNWWHPR